MSKIYTSRAFREKIVGMLLANAIIEEFKADEEKSKEMFGDGWKYIKQANTLIFKALQEGLSPNIGAEETAKIHDIARKHQIIMHRKGVPLPKDYTSLSTDHLFNIAEHAIANKCAGCTIEAYKECSLYEALKDTDMPPACYEKGKCPYLQ